MSALENIILKNKNVMCTFTVCFLPQLTNVSVNILQFSTRGSSYNRDHLRLFSLVTLLGNNYTQIISVLFPSR